MNPFQKIEDDYLLHGFKEACPDPSFDQRATYDPSEVAAKIDRSTLGHRERVVFRFFVLRANYMGEIEVGSGYVAWGVAMSQRTTQRVTKKLVERGLLRLVHRGGFRGKDGEGHPIVGMSSYRVDPAGLHEAPLPDHKDTVHVLRTADDKRRRRRRSGS